jgi:CubicO group peptidase (beta-lactamase class C family)
MNERPLEPMRSCYSEYVAWNILGDIAQRITGASLDETTQRALDRSGLDIHIQVDDARFDRLSERIGCYFWLDGLRPIPLLHDAVRTVATDSSAALGGYATMAAMVRWFTLFHGARGGNDSDDPGLFPSPDLIREAVRWEPRVRQDEVFGRDCQFAGGFMVDLARHGIGSTKAPAAIGHAGWVGTSFAFALPDGGACAALVNVVGFDASDLDGWRPQLSRLMLDAVGEATP